MRVKLKNCTDYRRRGFKFGNPFFCTFCQWRLIFFVLHQIGKMAAMFLGVFSSLLPAETVAFGKFSSSSTAKLFPPRLCVFRSSKISAAAKPTADTKNREPRGIMKPRRVSPEMQSFLGGVSEIPRTQALKEIWAHIKQHNLQVQNCFDSESLRP